MNVIVYLIRWTIGFFYFCLIAALGFIGLIFFKPQHIIILARPLCKAKKDRCKLARKYLLYIKQYNGLLVISFFLISEQGLTNNDFRFIVDFARDMPSVKILFLLILFP